jgi:hypothetical protein
MPMIWAPSNWLSQLKTLFSLSIGDLVQFFGTGSMARVLYRSSQVHVVVPKVFGPFELDVEGIGQHRSMML